LIRGPAGSPTACDLCGEGIQPRLPEVAVGSQPAIDVLQRGRVDGVQAAVARAAHPREAVLAQHSQVLRDGRLRDPEFLLDRGAHLAGGLLAVSSERQDAVVDVEELYGLPLERFVPERNALARELRAADRRDEAAAVAALRKPSVAARAVNRLAREHRRQLVELFTAGDTLSEVQSSVLAGRAGARALSEAAERERAAVSALVDAAGALLTAEGLAASSTVLERVGETLHAAALDDEARDPVDQGRLERELRHVGLGMGAGGDVAVPAKRKPAATRRRADAGDEAEARKQAEAKDRAQTERRAEAHREAKTAEADARREADRAATAVDAAERKRARAAEALDGAEEALTAARQAARTAGKAHRNAERELRRLEERS
jgi:hypothetical protein